jgi:dynein heavy chain 2
MHTLKLFKSTPLFLYSFCENLELLYCSTGRENKELEVLIFKEVLENIAIVDRVITKPGGSLLMAGRSGVGRRTAVSLVAHMHSIELFTPKISRGYQLKNFKNDLKTVS